MTEGFLTHEVGSLAKPEWRVKAVAGTKIGARDIQTAVTWGERLRINYDPLIEILDRGLRVEGRLPTEALRQIRDYAALYAIRLQEEAGLDVVYDGEQDRTEMYEHSIRNSTGFEFKGLIRAFDNKYYNKASCVDIPAVQRLWHSDEVKRLQSLTQRRIKVPITGAYTLATWSYDEYYAKGGGLGTEQGLEQKQKDREEFVVDLARRLIRPNILSLIEQGVTWIQIDEPAATTVPSEVSLFVKSFNESVRGLEGAEFSVHICFSDYRLLFPYIREMENCAQYSLEFANKDSKELGSKQGNRPGYEVLRLFRENNIPSRIGLGVSDIHSDFIESPELVRDRILYAVDILGDSSLVNPSPDCGLRTRSWEVAFQKISAVANGARLAALS